MSATNCAAVTRRQAKAEANLLTLRERLRKYMFSLVHDAFISLSFLLHTVDPFSIFAAKQLSDFDQFCVSLSAQCEDQETSSHDTPIIVGHIVPVKDAAVPGVWHRARVTRILPSR